ncbi:MAG TPA: peptidoglycan DD-metalloendopeptidase family protein [Stellaceae bacterium]|nr:peptidoglycan DD-metalloendopeptidase family protein [Stellaceae bacterium]
MALLLSAALGAATPFGAVAADNPTEPPRAAPPSEAPSRVQRDKLAMTAAALSAEIQGLRQQSISAAEATQRHESALTMLDAQLKLFAAAEKAKAVELRHEEGQRAGLLMALVRLARNPPEALALATPDPVAAERGALLMGATVPPLDRAARKLSSDLKQFAALRAAIAKAEAHHRAEQDVLNSQQAQLAELIARKSALEQQTQTGTQASDDKLAALAAEAANLKDLIEKLDAESAPAVATTVVATIRPPANEAQGAATAPQTVAAPATVPANPAKPPPIRSFLYATGRYLIPASGMLVRSFDKPNEVGIASKGLTYETRAGARVIAPFDGRVLFSGPFKGYGEILIIEHSDGYHSLVAGLAKLDVTVGQWLIAGEPVGVMPEGEDKPRLYLELRHDGQPINPLPWLATSNEKVSG